MEDMNGNLNNKLENGNGFQNGKMESHKTAEKDEGYEAITSDINVYDKILERVGGLGRYQWLHIVILFASIIPTGMFNLANALYAAVPGYRCVPEPANTTYSIIPVLVNNTGIPTYNISATTPLSYQTFPDEPCRLHNYTFLTSSLYANQTILQCPKWEYDTETFGTTIVSEWGFVCSREWLASLSQTVYMIGFFIGGLWVGWLSDKFGRKTAWIINVLLMIVSGMAASFMYSYWAFIAVRALSAMATTATTISAYVLLTENLGPKHRLNFAMWFHLAFAVGYMIMAIVGYFLKNMRHISIFMALTPILNIPLYWVIDESARWLLAEGRIPEARVIITRIARMNKAEYPTDLLDSESEQLLKAEREKIHSKNVSVIDLVRTPNMRFKIIIISYGWFICTLLYYGLSLGASSFVGGPFLNLFLSGSMEFPAILLSAYLLNKIGRKLVFSGSLIFSSLCCLTMAAIPQQYPIAITVFSLLGKCAITGSFSTVFIYTAELFPTVVRTIAVGTGSMFARVAGILAPSIALLGNYWMALPSLVFGVLTLIGGVLSFLLPETLNQRLPELLDDGEQFGKGSYKQMCVFPFNSKINKKPTAENGVAVHD